MVATVILCVAIISFTALYKSGWRPAFMASAFLTAITTMLLRLVGAVNDGVLYVTMFAVVAALLSLWFKRY